MDEEALGRMLDQYSERLVDMLDLKLAGLSLSNNEKDRSKQQAVAGAELEPGGSSGPGQTPRTDSLVESIEEHEDEGKEGEQTLLG
jgi:hypothetical protein